MSVDFGAILKYYVVRDIVLDHLSSNAIEFISIAENEDVIESELDPQEVYQAVVATLETLAMRYEDEDK